MNMMSRSTTKQLSIGSMGTSSYYMAPPLVLQCDNLLSVDRLTTHVVLTSGKAWAKANGQIL